MLSLEFKERIWGVEPYPSVIRLIGYKGLTEPEFDDVAKELVAKHGEEAVKHALSIVASMKYSKGPTFISLKHDVRGIVWPILGPDPANPPWWAALYKEQSSAPEQPKEAPAPKKPRRTRAAPPADEAKQSTGPA